MGEGDPRGDAGFNQWILCRSSDDRIMSLLILQQPQQYQRSREFLIISGWFHALSSNETFRLPWLLWKGRVERGQALSEPLPSTSFQIEHFDIFIFP